ncbi:MAG TPA: hypothetical protein VMS96_12575 [Terriglobales bacterium]|nr:hypothetical protein [Terriglobales bacterium]
MSAEADDRPQSHEELVDVFDTMEESEAMVVRGLLESAGIDAIITARQAPQDILPGVGGVLVRVSPERAEEARSLIEDYRNSAGADDDDVNDDSAA